MSKALIPRLRFPEFRDAAAWEEKSLSKLVKALDAGVSVNSGDRPANEGEAGVLKTSAVTNGVFEPSENKLVVDEAELKRLKEPVFKDTIIISRMNTPALVGANAYVKTSHESLFLPDRLWAAKPKPNVSMLFIACILGSEKGRAALSALASGTSGSMKNITKTDVFELKILVPSSDEQQKIADCLSSLDALLAAQADKLDTLKSHKKGLMQRLFPREGETVPELRFPEFREAGEWSQGRISQFLTESKVKGQKGNVARKLTVKLWGKGVYEKQEIFEGSENTQYYRRKSGQFIYSKLDFLNRAFGIVPEHLNHFESTVDLPCFDVSDGLDARFLLEYVQRKSFYKKLGEIADGGRKARRIQVETFLDFPIYVPSKKEQQRIADCLSSLDALIAAQAEKIDALKLHKKGLMQQLFPSPEAAEA